MAKDKAKHGGGTLDDDNVIHVAFGRSGDAREAESDDDAAPTHTNADGNGAPADPSFSQSQFTLGLGGPQGSDTNAAAVADLYTQAEVVRLLGISRGRLRALDKNHIVRPSGRKKGRRAYTFNDLIALRAARELLANRVKLKDVGTAVEKLRETLPRVSRPLAQLRIASDGQQVVVKTDEGRYEPVTGQMVLDFDVRRLHDEVVRMLRPSTGRDRARVAYELYLQASQLDEDPATMAQAEALYRAAIRHDPWLAIVYTNLGNICFRRSDERQAERLYRCALEIEPTQPEAQYNLGYMMLHRGRPSEAVRFFCGALESDPSFADAFFNLAMAYEQLEQTEDARRCWRRYLSLEPTGTWADIARQHLT